MLSLHVPKPKIRKYDEAYLAFGFTCATVGNEERLSCAVCLKVLACDSLKLRRHLETKHPEHKDKSVDFFQMKTHKLPCSTVSLY